MNYLFVLLTFRGRRGRNRMKVHPVPISTNVVSSNTAQGRYTRCGQVYQ